MSELVIRTNNVPRYLIDDSYLTPEERDEFDYLDWPAIDRGEYSATFFRYKGDLIDLGTLEVVQPGGELHELGWCGVVAWSAFYGLLVRWAKYDNGKDDTESIVVGCFYAKG